MLQVATGAYLLPSFKSKRLEALSQRQLDCIEASRDEERVHGLTCDGLLLLSAQFSPAPPQLDRRCKAS